MGSCKNASESLTDQTSTLAFLLISCIFLIFRREELNVDQKMEDDLVGVADEQGLKHDLDSEEDDDDFDDEDDDEEEEEKKDQDEVKKNGVKEQNETG